MTQKGRQGSVNVKTPDAGRFIALLGAVYAWATPDVIADLSEVQLLNLSRNLEFVQKTQAHYVAAEIIGAMGPMFGMKQTAKKK